MLYNPRGRGGKNGKEASRLLLARWRRSLLALKCSLMHHHNIIIILRSLPYIYLSLPYLTHDHFNQSSSDVRRIEQTWTSFAYKSRRHEYLNFYWLPKYYGELFLMESRFVSPETGDEVYDVSKWSEAASLPIFLFLFLFLFFLQGSGEYQ